MKASVGGVEPTAGLSGSKHGMLIDGACGMVKKSSPYFSGNSALFVFRRCILA